MFRIFETHENHLELQGPAGDKLNETHEIDDILTVSDNETKNIMDVVSASETSEGT